jgi:hypothetical protein
MSCSPGLPLAAPTIVASWSGSSGFGTQFSRVARSYLVLKIADRTARRDLWSSTS